MGYLMKWSWGWRLMYGFGVSNISRPLLAKINAESLGNITG